MYYTQFYADNNSEDANTCEHCFDKFAYNNLKKKKSAIKTCFTNDLLRRDEIWFTEKASDGVTTLYSLADFVDGDGMKIRKDESYEKNYLLGKYGAIPSLKSFDML